MTDDNPLAQVDLKVVIAPHAPDRFARGVMTRFDAVEASIAATAHRRRRRLVWAASSVAAIVAVIVAGLALWPAAPATSGSYSTTAPHHLVIGSIEADLETGATVTWKIERHRTVVDQHGNVTWTVPAGQTLRVEAAGVGSVEAENATLHVEARMNLMDKKGVTIASALAVTAIAVTVIHGKATVHGDKDMTVTPEHPVVVAPTPSATPVAVAIVYPGDQQWTRTGLRPLEETIDKVSLPAGSRIAAISYAETPKLEVEMGPATDFHGASLGETKRYTAQMGSGMRAAMKQAASELAPTKAAKQAIILVGDEQVEETELADYVRAGIAVVHIAPNDVYRYAAVTGGTITGPTSTVMLVYSGEETWTKAQLHNLELALTWVQLPAGSQNRCDFVFDRCHGRAADRPGRVVRCDEARHGREVSRPDGQ
ncbi:MAG: hypothetical protein QM831_44165 [Kofleriaceae bacterium]